MNKTLVSPSNGQAATSTSAGLWFSIKIDSDEFIALLSADALEKHFLPTDEKKEARNAYRRNRKLIDAAPGLDALRRWSARMVARPSVERGMAVPG